MKVEVQFFSRLKDVACAEKIERELRNDTLMSDLLAALYRDFPALEKWDAHIRVAVGVEWVGRDHTLHEGDAVSIMPPVSGG